MHVCNWFKGMELAGVQDMHNVPVISKQVLICWWWEKTLPKYKIIFEHDL